MRAANRERLAQWRKVKVKSDTPWNKSLRLRKQGPSYTLDSPWYRNPRPFVLPSRSWTQQVHGLDTKAEIQAFRLAAPHSGSAWPRGPRLDISSKWSLPQDPDATIRTQFGRQLPKSHKAPSTSLIRVGQLPTRCCVQSQGHGRQGTGVGDVGFSASLVALRHAWGLVNWH